MNKEDLLRKLKQFCKGKSQAQAGRELGISQQYLNDILLGYRPIAAPPILRKFGLKKVVEIREDK